jgi:hypothetical protein
VKNPLSLLTVVAAAALSLTACDESPARVCTDQSGRRVDDGLCANRAGGASGGWGGGSGGGGNSWLYRWYYMRGSSAPAVGGFASGGSFAPEAGVSYSSVSRGGFGGEARGFGGFHGFG